MVTYPSEDFYQCTPNARLVVGDQDARAGKSGRVRGHIVGHQRSSVLCSHTVKVEPCPGWLVTVMSPSYCLIKS